MVVTPGPTIYSVDLISCRGLSGVLVSEPNTVTVGTDQDGKGGDGGSLLPLRPRKGEGV